MAKNIPCAAPGLEKKAQIEEYLLKLYPGSANSRIKLVTESKANEECFWKLQYLATSPQRNITIYLSPDGQSIAPELYDLRNNPLNIEAATMLEITKGLTATNAPSLGNPQAPVIIVEFVDFQCPYCKDLSNLLEKQIVAKQGDKVRLVFRNFPIPSHQWAKPAAQMAMCVAMQNTSEFWKIHDYLFEHQPDLTSSNIRSNVLAFVQERPALNAARFETCVDTGLSTNAVVDDIALAQKYSIHVAPTFVLNGEQYYGEKSLDELNELISTALRRRESRAIQAK
jgi:protein-disulfide isomerase